MWFSTLRIQANIKKCDVVILSKSHHTSMTSVTGDYVFIEIMYCCPGNKLCYFKIVSVRFVLQEMCRKDNITFNNISSTMNISIQGFKTACVHNWPQHKTSLSIILALQQTFPFKVLNLKPEFPVLYNIGNFKYQSPILYVSCMHETQLFVLWTV